MSITTLPRRSTHPPRRAIGLACGMLLALPALAQGQAQTFEQLVTLRTSGQSLLGSSGWTYDSGFQGSRWGTYGGKAPSSFGIDAITGSERAVIIPGTPGTPDIPGTPSKKVCTIFGCITIPGIPGIPGIPPTPPVYGDTRTGASARFESSGEVGLRTTASASGGTLSATLPFATSLHIGNADANGKFHVDAGATLTGDARLTTTGPVFRADLDATITLKNKFSATGCVLGAGCSTSSSPVNIDTGTFRMLGASLGDAATVSVGNLALPVVKYGTDYEFHSDGVLCAKGSPLCTLGREPVVATLRPTVLSINLGGVDDLDGGTVQGQTVRLQGSNRVVTTKADLTGIAQAVGNLPVDVLNPNVVVAGVAAMSGTLVQGEAGTTLNLTQNLSLDTKVNVSLNFDRAMLLKIGTSEVENIIGTECDAIDGNGDPLCRAITEWVTVDEWQQVGSTVTFAAGAGVDLMYADSPGQLRSFSYAMADGTDLTTRYQMAVAPVLSLDAGCTKIELLAVGSALPRSCAYRGTYEAPSLGDFEVYNQKVALGGFNTVTISAVPEPTTLASLLAGLVLVGASVRRRRAATA